MAENGSAMASENPREGSEELMTGPRAGSIAGKFYNLNENLNYYNVVCLEIHRIIKRNCMQERMI